MYNMFAPKPCYTFRQFLTKRTEPKHRPPYRRVCCCKAHIAVQSNGSYNADGLPSPHTLEAVCLSAARLWLQIISDRHPRALVKATLRVYVTFHSGTHGPGKKCNKRAANFVRKFSIIMYERGPKNKANVAECTFPAIPLLHYPV